MAGQEDFPQANTPRFLVAHKSRGLNSQSREFLALLGTKPTESAPEGYSWLIDMGRRDHIDPTVRPPKVSVLFALQVNDAVSEEALPICTISCRFALTKRAIEVHP